MSAEISIADVDQAEAALSTAKQKYHGSGKSPDHKDEFLEAKRNVVRLRTAWRAQEEQAGRRGLVGGDAVKVEG